MDYMRLACEAGFGGVARRTLASRLKQLIDLAAKEERQACADICLARGDHFKEITELQSNDFRDGQMDGAYSCAELILERK